MIESMKELMEKANRAMELSKKAMEENSPIGPLAQEISGPEMYMILMGNTCKTAKGTNTPEEDKKIIDLHVQWMIDEIKEHWRKVREKGGLVI